MREKRENNNRGELWKEIDVVMSTFVVIDTETTWTDDVMSIGAVIADGTDFSVIDSRYYLIDPAFRYGGMYSGVLRMRGTPKEIMMLIPLSIQWSSWIG